MPTRRGWGLGWASLALAAGGRVFGIVELSILAATSLALVVAATVTVRLRVPRLATRRTLHPHRVHAGSTSRIELELVNEGARRSPVVSVHDPFAGGLRRARFLVPPLAPGASSRAAYRLPSEERGVFEIGPLEVVVADPFGLASTGRPAAPVTRLVVYPRIDDIPPLPDTPGDDSRSRPDHARALVGGGDDFFALRPYELGDDTRRVHWPSSARLDELMIRQDEQRQQSRVTIVLDTRAGVHDDASLELAVSAAASVHEASRRAGAVVRYVGTDGVDSRSGGGRPPTEVVMEHLATVRASRGEGFASLASRLNRGAGGALVVVTTSVAPPSDLAAVARLQRGYRRVVLVMVERAGHRVAAGNRGTEVGGDGRDAVSGRWAEGRGAGTVVRISDEEPFARAWDRVLMPAYARPGLGGRRR